MRLCHPRRPREGQSWRKQRRCSFARSWKLLTPFVPRPDWPPLRTVPRIGWSYINLEAFFCERNVFLSLCWISCEARVFVSSRPDVHAAHKGKFFILFFPIKEKRFTYIDTFATLAITLHIGTFSVMLSWICYLFIYILFDDWYRTSFWSLWKRHTKRSTALQGHQNRGTPMVSLFAVCPYLLPLGASLRYFGYAKKCSASAFIAKF